MGLLFTKIWNILVDHFSIGGKDPRTRDLPLATNYTFVLLIIATYIVLVLKIGPKFMTNRRPYNVKTAMQIYNVIQILVNFVIFVGLTRLYILNPNFNWVCMKYDPTDNTFMSIRKYAFMYFIMKITDFMDTIFFILRKKFNQVTFLHTYHHAIMAWAAFIYINLLFGSDITMVGLVNSLVHALMYTYYFLSASNLNRTVAILKPYLTLIQILQFSFYTIKYLVAFFNYSWCGLSRFWLAMLAIQNLYMTAMFSDFYIKAYIVKKGRQSAKVD